MNVTIKLAAGCIPEPVLVDMVRTGRVPVRDTTADERAWCRYALNQDAAGAAACPELRSEPGCRPWCALNGPERRTPCAFDEPDTAPIWRRIQKYLAGCRERGWL